MMIIIIIWIYGLDLFLFPIFRTQLVRMHVPRDARDLDIWAVTEKILPSHYDLEDQFTKSGCKQRPRFKCCLERLIATMHGQSANKYMKHGSKFQIL